MRLVVSASPRTMLEVKNTARRQCMFIAMTQMVKLDPHVKNTFSGPATGVGSVCSWQGNSDIGAGSSTITETKPGELVRLRMDWKEPMEGVSTVDFTFRLEGGKTVMTWHMYGPQNYVGKVMCLFMNMDKMVGGQFEQGLENLKTLAEAPASK